MLNYNLKAIKKYIVLILGLYFISCNRGKNNGIDAEDETLRNKQEEIKTFAKQLKADKSKLSKQEQENFIKKSEKIKKNLIKHSSKYDEKKFNSTVQKYLGNDNKINNSVSKLSQIKFNKDPDKLTEKEQEEIILNNFEKNYLMPITIDFVEQFIINKPLYEKEVIEKDPFLLALSKKSNKDEMINYCKNYLLSNEFNKSI